MRLFVISTTLACLLASASSVSAGGPRGHALGADLARLSPGAAAPMPDLGEARTADIDGEAPAASASACPAEAEAACVAPGAAAGR